MGFNEAVGTVLRRERHKQRHTLSYMSHVSFLSLGYLSEIERGVKDPSAQALELFAGALRLSVPQLLRETADELDRREAPWYALDSHHWPEMMMFGGQA